MTDRQRRRPAAVVTGGGGGIGTAVALGLARHDIAVVAMVSGLTPLADTLGRFLTSRRRRAPVQLRAAPPAAGSAASASPSRLESFISEGYFETVVGDG